MINLRCSFCQNLYTVSRNEIVAALQTVEAENLHHYDSHCPRCRHANPISRERLELAVPNWREILNQTQTSAAANPMMTTSMQTSAPAAPQPASQPAMISQSMPSAPKPAMKKAIAKKSPAKKAPAKKAVKKKAPAKKAASKKSKAKKSAKKSKRK